jgi:Mn-dependent DtxR family transcriptional regulator
MNPTEPTKKKDTIRISKKDLLKLLSDNEQQAKQIKDLQGRCNEYLEEVRSLKKDLEEAEAALLEGDKEESMADRIKKAMDSVKEDIQRNPMPVHPFGPDIYLDGASKFGR